MRAHLAPNHVDQIIVFAPTDIVGTEGIMRDEVSRVVHDQRIFVRTKAAGVESELVGKGKIFEFHRNLPKNSKKVHLDRKIVN